MGAKLMTCVPFRHYHTKMTAGKLLAGKVALVTGAPSKGQFAFQSTHYGAGFRAEVVCHSADSSHQR